MDQLNAWTGDAILNRPVTSSPDVKQYSRKNTFSRPVSRKTRIVDMGNGVSNNPGALAEKSDKRQITKHGYQQLYDLLGDYRDRKTPLSMDDIAALQGFLPTTQQGEYSQARESLTAMKRELSSLQKQRQDILNRISEVAGARLKSNNPAIADLSDQNRPSKLAEKFSELYDNEWTDAAEEMKKVMKFTKEEDRDIGAIKFLYDFTKATYDLCRKKTEEQLRQVQSAVCFHNDSRDLSVELDRKCRDLIREHCEVSLCQAVEVLPADVIKSLPISEELKLSMDQLKNGTHTMVFFKLCTRLCWMMALQDPPICMVTNTDSTEIYRAYTRSGDVIEYVVWPSLLLHEDGPLLYKGVAQFRRKSAANPQVTTEAKPSSDSREHETPSIESSSDYENVNFVEKDTNSNNIRSTVNINMKSEGGESPSQTQKGKYRNVITVGKISNDEV